MAELIPPHATHPLELEAREAASEGKFASPQPDGRIGDNHVRRRRTHQSWDRRSCKRVLAPFTELLVRLHGGACDEIGKGLTASVAGLSLKRQIRLWQRAQQMISDAGFYPRGVPPKIIFTIVQNASIEDDHELQDKWAALLANATNPSLRDEIQPAYPDMLRQLSKNDVYFSIICMRRSLRTPMTPRRIIGFCTAATLEQTGRCQDCLRGRLGREACRNRQTLRTR